MDEYLAEMQMDAADGEPDDGDDAAPATTAPVAAPSVPTPAAPTVAPPAPTPAATTVAPTAPTPAAPTTAPVVPALSALNGIAALERPRPVMRVASVLLLWKRANANGASMRSSPKAAQAVILLVYGSRCYCISNVTIVTALHTLCIYYCCCYVLVRLDGAWTLARWLGSAGR